MRILLLGGTGQLGTELIGPLSLFAAVEAPTRQTVDMSDLGAVERAIRTSAPDVIVNAAAYNDVDEAEVAPALAYRINSEVVGAIRYAAERVSAGIVHFSTDYVFDGEKDGFYTEEEAPNPISEYGMSKLMGEKALAGASALIIRTAWLYEPTRKNFVSMVLRRARKVRRLQMVEDQFGSPTYARDLAQAVAMMLYVPPGGDVRRKIDAYRGIYHVAGLGVTSRYGLAEKVLQLDPRKSEHKATEVEPVSSTKFALRAKRPKMSALNTDKLRHSFGIELPPWWESLRRALRCDG